MCNVENTGCQAHIWVTCADITSGVTQAAFDRAAAQFCSQRGYSNSATRQLSHTGGGRCGYYRYAVTCR